MGNLPLVGQSVIFTNFMSMNVIIKVIYCDIGQTKDEEIMHFNIFDIGGEFRYGPLMTRLP